MFVNRTNRLDSDRTGWSKSVLLHAMAIIFIFVISLFKLGDYKMLVIMSDEFGYWSNAEIMIKGNWVDLAKESPYYSAGYSFFLIPILWFAKTFDVAYKAALVLNAVLLAVEYICAYKIITSFSGNDASSRLLPVMESLVCVLCCSNLYYAKTGLCETLVTALFWCIAALFVSLEKSFGYVKLVIMLLLAVYAYYTHQRYMGLLVVLGVCLAILLIRKKRPVPLVLVLVFVLFAFMSQKYVRDFQNSFLNIGAGGRLNETNVDGAMVGGKISRILDNLEQFADSICGKLFSAFFFSFGVYFVGLWGFGRKVYNMIKRKERPALFVSELFFLLCIVGMVGLSSIQLLGYSRKDIIVYSRYMECVFGPFLLLSVDYFVRNRKDKTVFAVFTAGLFIMSLITIIIYKNYSLSSGYFNDPCNPLIGSVFELLRKNTYKVSILILLVLVLVVIALRATAQLKDSVSGVIACVVLLFVNLFFAYHVTEWEIHLQEKYYGGIEPVYAQLQEHKDLPVYFLKDDENYRFSNNAKYLQFVIYERRINIIEDIDELKGKGEVLLLTNPVNDNFDKKYTNIASAQYLKAYLTEVT